MKPINLCIEKFMGHSQSDIDFTNFNSCLIVGVNKNNNRISNGVGKSTIFHAIEYVLYNEYPCKKAEKIIKDGESKCKVEFIFEINEQIYKARRERTKSVSNLYLERQLTDGSWEEISGKSNSETELELLKIIKLNYKAFKNCVLFSQGDLDGLASTSSDKRKDLLKEPLQLSNYNAYSKAAKKKLDTEKLNFEKNQVLVESLGNPSEDIDLFTIKVDEIKNSNVFNKKEKNSLQVLLESQVQSLSDLDNTLKSAASNTVNQIHDLDVDLKVLNSDLKKSLGNDETNSKKLEFLLLNLVNKQSTLDEKKTLLTQIQVETKRNILDVKKELESVSSKESDGKNFLLNLKNQKNKLEKELPEKSKCDICLQNIGEDHRHNYSVYKESKITEINSNYELYSIKLDKCIACREALSKEIYEIEFYNDKIKSLISDIANYKSNILLESESVSTYKDIVKQNKITIEDLKNKIYLAEQRKDHLLSISVENKTEEINDKILKLKLNINISRSSINKLIETISSSDTFLGVYAEKLHKRQDDLLKLNVLIADAVLIRKQINLNEKVLKAFGPNGIPTMIINNILDDLQIEGNSILSEMRPSLQFQFISNNETDSLDIIFNVHGKNRDYELLSGGQKLYFALAFKLGLSKVIQKRVGIKINFIGLDEVDQSLDLDGIDAFSDIIKKLQNQFKILIITHNEHIKSKFNHFIIVEGDDANGSCAKYSANLE